MKNLIGRRAGLAPPSNAVDTAALLMITALLRQTDPLHVMQILSIELPCTMDAFGIIRQRDHLLSPGADLLLLLLREVRAAASELY